MVVYISSGCHRIQDLSLYIIMMRIYVRRRFSSKCQYVMGWRLLYADGVITITLTDDGSAKYNDCLRRASSS